MWPRCLILIHVAQPIYKFSSIFCFKPILLSAHKLILLIYGDNTMQIAPWRFSNSNNQVPGRSKGTEEGIGRIPGG